MITSLCRFKKELIKSCSVIPFFFLLLLFFLFLHLYPICNLFSRILASYHTYKKKGDAVQMKQEQP